MKTMITSILLVACAFSATTAAYGFPTGVKAPTVEDALSPEGRALLRQAAFRMLSDLCSANNPEPSVYETICKRAYDMQAGSDTPTQACMSCPVADPICVASCPK